MYNIYGVTNIRIRVEIPFPVANDVVYEGDEGQKWNFVLYNTELLMVSLASGAQPGLASEFAFRLNTLAINI